MSLKAARERSGKTQAQVAKLTGITERSYQRIESGKTTTVDTALLLARVLNSTVEELFGAATPDDDQCLVGSSDLPTR